MGNKEKNNIEKNININKKMINNIKEKLKDLDDDSLNNLNKSLEDNKALKENFKGLSSEQIEQKMETLEQWEEKINKKQINLKLTETQLTGLEKLSTKMGGVSKSNLIRIAITEYLMKYKELL
ncbi:hypothetical protein MBCUT_15200 [Methanobrevibacter cuticularis]|uniref:Ribbon-helix-helix protein CopG domain-containing protein n=1 Tax=Methanobrevibacter cuticularis TaxID=47311 RepID=A0A166DC91_9EURY|nr:ribbon-helix-helix protein, CopG family [Methanobrevibacter cuticularis]KZX15434.1 hypothetical protein MBCUT_15200 [Methanobrevibacter cuticularis]